MHSSLTYDGKLLLCDASPKGILSLILLSIEEAARYIDAGLLVYFFQQRMEIKNKDKTKNSKKGYTNGTEICPLDGASFRTFRKVLSLYTKLFQKHPSIC